MDNIVFVILCGLVFILPWEQNYSVEGMQTGARIIGAAAFLAGAAVTLLTLKLRPLHKAFIPLCLFVAWTAASMLWSVAGEWTSSLCITYVLLLLFLWLIWQYADTTPRQLWLLRVFIFGTLLAMVNLFRSFSRGGEPLNGAMYARFTASDTNANGMATCLIFSINFAYYLVLRVRTQGLGFLKLGYWGFILAAAVGVFLTGSRAGFIGLALSVAVTGFFLLGSGQAGWKMIVMFVLCIGAGIYVIPRLVPETLQERVTGKVGEGAESRFAVWQRSLKTWTEKPLLGGGSGTEGAAHNWTSHNTFITILVDDGLIGFGLFVAFWIMLIAAIRSFPKMERQFWITVLAGYSPALLTGSANHEKTLWFLWAMILAQTITVAKNKALPRPNQPPLRRFRTNAA